jgi:hypothetical protein
MTATSPEKKAETNLKGQTLLDPGKVNLVGESHDLSQAARGLEKEFVKEMMGSDAGYWTEDEFPARRGERDAGQGERAADPMELRGAQAAVEAIDQFADVCSAALDCNTFADCAETTVRNIHQLVLFQDGLNKSWDPTQASKLMTPAMFDAMTRLSAFFETTTQQFLTDSRSALSAGDIEDVKKAYTKTVQELGSSRDDLYALSDQLSAAVGAWQKDPGALSAEINVMGSDSMAEEVASSDLAGVWKVGDQHIEDLTAGMAEAEINPITEDDFEGAFVEWAELRHPAEWAELHKEWAKLRQQRPAQQAETET